MPNSQRRRYVLTLEIFWNEKQKFRCCEARFDGLKFVWIVLDDEVSSSVKFSEYRCRVQNIF